MSKPRLLIAIGAMFVVAGSASAEAPFIMGLGQLDTRANGISPNGQYVSGTGGNGLAQAFRWTRSGGLLNLGVIAGDVSSTGADVSNTGVVVGQSVGNSSNRPFRWTEGAGMVGLGEIPGFPAISGSATGISADGSVISGTSGTSRDQAFKWTSGTGMVGLGFLSANGFSRGTGISDDGLTIGGYASLAGSARDYFFWRGDTGIVDGGNISGNLTRVIAAHISSGGDFLVGRSESNFAGVATRANRSGGVDNLGDLPGGELDGTAACVSADGMLVLGTGFRDHYEGSIWDPVHGMRTLTDVLTGEYGLDLSHWEQIFPADMTPDGQYIVGYGNVAGTSGRTEGFLLHIPEPGTIFLMGVVGVGLRMRRRGR